MIFVDQELDNVIEEHNTAQIITLTFEGFKLFKDKFTFKGFADITDIFLDSAINLLEVDGLIDKCNACNHIFDINKFYKYHIYEKKLSYSGATWAFYFTFQKILPHIKTKFIILGFKRLIVDRDKFDGNTYDTLLFSDFVDLTIFPIYQEFKLFAENMVSFNEFVSYVQATGEVPDRYNESYLQYMKREEPNVRKFIY